MSAALPDVYRVLAATHGEPQDMLAILKRSGLWDERTPLDPQSGEPLPRHVTDAERAVFRTLVQDRRIRWVKWGHVEGYVLTGLGEAALDAYHARYGPALVKRGGT